MWHSNWKTQLMTRKISLMQHSFDWWLAVLYWKHDFLNWKVILNQFLVINKFKRSIWIFRLNLPLKIRQLRCIFCCTFARWRRRHRRTHKENKHKHRQSARNRINPILDWYIFRIFLNYERGDARCKHDTNWWWHC